MHQFAFTHHAVERFNQRIVPELTYDRAKTLLELRSTLAAPLKNKSINGQGVWKIEEPGALLITKRENRGVVVVVTVVPPEEEWETTPSGHLLDKMEESGFLQQMTRRLNAIRSEHLNRLEGQKRSYDKKCKLIIEEYNRRLQAVLQDYPPEQRERLEELGLIPGPISIP